MTDIATISLKADTSDLERGTQKLKEFGATAEKVNNSAENLNEQFKRGVDNQKKATQAAEKQRKELHELLNQLNPTNKAFERLDEWQEKLSSASKKGMLSTDQFNDYNSILEQTRDKLQKMHMSLTVEGQALLAQEAATNRAKLASDEFLQSLRSQTEILGKTKTEVLELKAAQMGVSQQAAPMIAKLKEQEKAFLNGSITIGQYRNAMRQLPMQMTDIVTSLASGMPVWMVMVQQGGQIKDSFGGIGNSLKALASFFTPAKIAMIGTIGALTAVAVAAYKGSTEFSEYNKQLVLTGGYAGKTASQLDILAKKLAINGITQFSSSKALSQVVATGSFRGGELELVAKTAVEMQEKVGVSIDETIKNFQKLKESPTRASEELNKQMHYLTAAQYEYISSLERKGNKEEAARVATELYGKASQKSASEVVNHLNWIGQAAKETKDLILGLGDAIAGMGREKGFDEKYAYDLEQINKTIDNIYKDREKSGVSDLFESGLKKSLAQKAVIENILGLHNAIVAGKQAENAAEQDSILSLEYKNKIIEEGLSKETKRARDLAQLWREISKAPDKWSQSEREKAVSAINKRYETKTPKATAYRPDYGTRVDESANEALVSLQAQLKVLKEHKTVADVISSERKKLWDMEAKISVLEEAKATRKLTKDEQALLAKKEYVLASQRSLAVVGDEVELQKQKNNELDKQNKYIADLVAKGNALEEGAGLSSRLQQRKSALNQADTEEKKKALEDYYAKEDSIRANWELGVKRGFAEFQDQATDVYGNVSQISQSFFQGMSNSLSDFVITGKASLGDFTRSFLEMTTKMLMQMAMLNSMKAAFGGTAVGNFLGMAKFDSGGYTGDGGKYDPAGIVHRGEFVFDKDSTAKLGKANLYRLMDAGKKGYASGGYVGGSQPMSVNQSRVQVYGAQPAGGINVNVNLNGITAEGGTQQQGSMLNVDIRAAEQSLNNKIKRLMVTEGREGGDLYKIIKAVSGGR
ncbi:phage tail tape measure protein [Providencia alcalifaciens]